MFTVISPQHFLGQVSISAFLCLALKTFSKKKKNFGKSKCLFI